MNKEIRKLLECLIQEAVYSVREAKLKAYTLAVDLLLKNQQLFDYEPEHMHANSLDLRSGNIKFFDKKCLLIIDRLEAAAGAGRRCIYRSKGVRVFLFDDGNVMVVTPHSLISKDGMELHNEAWWGEEIPTTIEDVEDIISHLDEPGKRKSRIVSEEIIKILCNINQKYIKSYCLEYILTPPDVNVISKFSKVIRDKLWEELLSFDNNWPIDDVNLCIDLLIKNELPPQSNLLIDYISKLSKRINDREKFETLLNGLEKRLSKKIEDSISTERLHEYFTYSNKKLHAENLPDEDKVKKVSHEILSQFKDLVENKGLWKQFWDESSKHKNEKSAQEIFYAVADSFCKANNIDLSPESNFGNGPVDFKFSNGYHSKVIVEVKLSTNTKLVHGYKKQLEIYKSAESTHNGIFLIIDIGGLGEKHAQVLQLKQQNPMLSEVWYVNAEYRESASKRI